MKQLRHNEKVTLTDHIAVAFLNTMIAVSTGLLLWLALNGVPVTWAGWLPFQAVVWFVAIVVIVGAFVQDVWLANFYGWVWRGLVGWFSQL